MSGDKIKCVLKNNNMSVAAKADRVRAMNWVADLVSHGVVSNAVKHLLEGGGDDNRALEVLGHLGATTVPRRVLVAILLAYAREQPGQLPRASRILAFLDDPVDRDAALTYALDLGDHHAPSRPPRNISSSFVHQW